MNGLTPFLFGIIAVVTIAQIAGNSSRAKKNFDNQKKKANAANTTKAVKKKDLRKLNEGKISEDAPVPSFEADNSFAKPEDISDINNPFEAK